MTQSQSPPSSPLSSGSAQDHQKDPHQDHILVIKLGALGDFVLALGPMAAIRAHHPHAHIVLLTTAPYVEFAEASGLFDQVWVDDKRPKAWQIKKVLDLRSRLKSGTFSRVYDLQTSDRSSFYFHILCGLKRPEWSGIATGCSHPHTNPNRDLMHTIDRQKEQLSQAGIADVPPCDVSWAWTRTQTQTRAQTDISRFGLVPPYALIVPGGAPHRPEKRWPEHHYVDLANHLLANGLTPVLLGTKAESTILHLIEREAPGSVNVCGKTDFFDLATLANQASLAVGNDTGPMHLIAAAHCPSLVLYSYASDPALCAQRGKAVKILRKDPLNSLNESEVWDAVQSLCGDTLTGA